MRRFALAFLLLTLAGCNEDRTLDETRFFMGTYVRIKIWGASDSLLQVAINAAFSEVERIDSLTSVFNPESAVSLLNSNGEIVSEELATLVSKALEISRISGGKFDPTILPLMTLWGFTDSNSSSRRVPSGGDISSALRLVDYKRIEVSGDTVRIIGMPHRSAGDSTWGIDLSGIAEGYAVDMAIGVLMKYGIRRGLVDAGGDIGCFGERRGGWSIGIRNPRGEGLAGIVHIGSGGIGTSGDYENFFEKDGVRYHHLMDPATGYPARGVTSATVIAPTATEADAWTKPLFILGEKGVSLLDSLGGIQGMIILEDGRIAKTKEFPKIESP